MAPDVKCFANLFQLKLDASKVPYLYNLSFVAIKHETPSPVDEEKKWRRIVSNRRTKAKVKEALGLDLYVYISSTVIIGIPSKDVKVATVSFEENECRELSDPFQLRFERRDNPILRETPEYRSFVNNIIGHAIREAQFSQVNKCHYDLKAKPLKPHASIELYPGIETQFLSTNDGYDKLQILPKFLVLQAGNALEDLRRLKRLNLTNEKIAETFRNKFFITKHTDQPYRCDSIIWETPEKKPAMEMEFVAKNGEQISVREYFARQYPAYSLQLNPKAPLLVYKDKRSPDKQMMFPIELCQFKGLTQQQDADNQLKSQLSQETRKPPEFRITVAKALAERLTAPLEKMGMSIETDASTITGKTVVVQSEFFRARVSKSGSDGVPINENGMLFLNNATDCFGRCQQIYDDGLEGPQIQGLLKKRWILVHHAKAKDEARSFFETLKRQFSRPPFSKQSFIVEMPVRISVDGIDPRDWRKAADDGIKESVQAATAEHVEEDEANPFIIVVLLPRAKRESDQIYKLLKNFFANLQDQQDAEYHVILSQFVSSATLQPRDTKKFEIAMEKIAYQIYNKMGAVVWTMPRQSESYSRMVIGIDSSKIPASETFACATVATTDPDMSGYYSSNPSTAKDSIILGLRKFVMNALKAYIDRAKDIPDHLIVYRNGGSAGELSKMQEFEVGAVKDGLQDALVKIGKWRQKEEDRRDKLKLQGKDKKAAQHDAAVLYLSKPMPKVMFTVCNKNVQYRFALQRPKVGNSNPPAGTVFKRGVVEEGLNRKNMYEFLCIHQMVHKSASVTPTRYMTVYNDIPENELSEDDFQILTQQLACMYPNWTGMVRLPAPVMLANKLTRLAVDLLQNTDTIEDREYYSTKLRNRLWYL